MDSQTLNRDPNAFYENLYPPEDIFFDLGVIGTILKEATDGVTDSIDTMRGILAIFTVSPEFLKQPDKDSVEDFALMGVNALKEYFKTINENFPVSFETLKQNKGFGLFAKRAFTMRAQGDIQWFNYPDPLFSSSLTDDTLAQVDMDVPCQVTLYEGRPAIRWSLPEPQNYWQCENPDKLIYTALVLAEELLHISQLRTNGIYIHTFGTEFTLYQGESKEKEVLQNCIVQLQESDVTNIITTTMPFVLQERFQWYHDRLKSPRTEKHFPLTIDRMWLIGHLYARFMDQAGEFMMESFESLPPYLVSPRKEYKSFFSNQVILYLFQEYVQLFEFDFNREDDREGDQLYKAVSSLLLRELKRVGVIELFLKYCAELKIQYQQDWKNHLDKSHDANQYQHGTNVLNKITGIFIKQPLALGLMLDKYKERKPYSHLIQDTESLVDMFCSLL